MERESGGADGAAFARALSALKERGSNLLVVGPAVDDGHPAICDRLLGEAPDRPRRHVHVRVGGECGIDVGQPTPATRRVIEHETRTRDAAAATAPSPVPPEPAGGLDADDLAAAAADAIEDVEAAAGGLDSAELRLCLDSLLPMLAEADEARVDRALDRLTDRVRAVRGMGHYHLPVPRADHYVDLLEPHVDAVVEVRARHGRPEHRWRLLNANVESDWLPV